jgi:hypothetical protein
VSDFQTKSNIKCFSKRGSKKERGLKKMMWIGGYKKKERKGEVR